jgi:hypothetical protein
MTIFHAFVSIAFMLFLLLFGSRDAAFTKDFLYACCALGNGLLALNVKLYFYEYAKKTEQPPR